jgi:hypothetical protein
MPARDILDQDEVTVQPGEHHFGPWIPTAGLQRVALAFVNWFSGLPNYTIEESHNATDVIAGYHSRDVVPGAAFVRVHLDGINMQSATTVVYSLRGVS